MANRSPLMQSKWVACRQSGRPSADSAPVYEGKRTEVSRDGKSPGG
jgi:hypothetical protein